MSVEVPVLDHEAIVAAVSPSEAIDRTAEAFVRFREGHWVMPPKLYLLSPPHGDFRAMPALGDGFALLKWITSFPLNRAKGLPTVGGILCLSDAQTGELRMLLDARAVTALRTGAVAAVAAKALARPDAATAGVIGCGVHGSWAACCLAAAGFGPGVCFDPDPTNAQRTAEELGWTVGSRDDALACDVVTFVTPGAEPVLFPEDLRPGLHLNMLGADGPGKAEATVDAVVRCELYCDDWVQASHGGEVTLAVEQGLVDRTRVTELGDVLTGRAPGRSSPEAVTLFDSTGLAIQDLAIAVAAWRRWQEGTVQAATIRL